MTSDAFAEIGKFQEFWVFNAKSQIATAAAATTTIINVIRELYGFDD